jgi:transcription-repair coupling factor (superfamily II helicase)
MTTLEAGGIKGEYLMLTYANDAKLYVPVSSLHLISRYAGGAEENAPLHKLGGDAWARAPESGGKSARRGGRAAGYLRPARGERGLRL